jgi:DNA-binding MarR family transcriptional regulator
MHLHLYWEITPLVKIDASAFNCYSPSMGTRENAISDATVMTWARLLRVSHQLLSAVERDLKEKQLPPLSWYDALLELKRAGSAGLRPFELQKEMLLAQYNLSRLVDRLEGAGYLRRMPAKGDGRGQILKITGEGRALLRQMWPVYQKAIWRHFGERLSESETRSLCRILGCLDARR